MKQRIPALLKPGDLIGLSATARFATREMIATAKAHIEDAGFKVIYSEDILLQVGQVAGTNEARIRTTNMLIHHQDVKAIWNIRGGYGSAEIVDDIDWVALQEQPKWLIGFSDFTTFLAHAFQKGILSLHAAMPVSFETTNPEDLRATFELLQNGPLPLSLTEVASPCSGKVIGGNLSVIYSIFGTPSLPTLDGTVLLLEDLDEYHYHLDRMLLALKRRGAFKGLRAVLFGQFSDIHDHATPWCSSLEYTLVKYFEASGVPVLRNLPFGHTARQFPIIIGSQATISKHKISFSL
tara:strand:+ start:12776 stop:13657 length:882 start_codon:yes stop_codon:yes gene_type:complete